MNNGYTLYLSVELNIILEGLHCNQKLSY
jgi:hypothetical protein